MISQRWMARVGPVAFGLTCGLTAGCDGTTDVLTPVKAQAQDTTPAVVKVVTVNPTRETLRHVTREPCQIEAFETTEIHANIAGYVKTLHVDIGDRIEAGQVLTELEVPEVEADLQRKMAHLDQDQADLRRAEAMVGVAEAAVVTAEAQVATARAATRRTEAEVARWKAEYDRTAQLVREGAVTGSLLDETRSKLEAAEAAREETAAQIRLAEAGGLQAHAEQKKAQADVEVSRAHVTFAEADVRHAEALASYTRIIAPYDGIVTRRLVDTGHLTVPGRAGDPLFVIARTDRVRIAVGVPEVDAPRVDVGDPAEVRLQALDGRTFEGSVSRISWALDQATRTLRAEIDLENPNGTLRPGLYAYATIIAAESPNALAVPATALARDNTGKNTCVVVADGIAQRREVTIGISDGTRVEILTGLDEKDAVVASGGANLTDGQTVEAQAALAAKP